jgi:hypothetical protein
MRSDKARAMRAKIHIARKQLAMDEEGYRAALRRGAGISTTSCASLAQLEDVLVEMRRLGFRDPGRRPARTAQIRMIHAIWRDLTQEGAVRAEDTEAALRAFVERQTRTPARPHGIAAVEFLDSVWANRVIEGLKAWRKRHRASAAAAESVT